MPTITAPSNAAMDVCSSPSVGSNDARPPAAENQAAAFSEGGVGVEGSRRSSAAIRLDYDNVTVTTGDQGTCPVPVEGAVVTSWPADATDLQDMPQMAKDKDDKVIDASIEVDTSEWTLEDWLHARSMVRALRGTGLERVPLRH